MNLSVGRGSTLQKVERIMQSFMKLFMVILLFGGIIALSGCKQDGDSGSAGSSLSSGMRSASINGGNDLGTEGISGNNNTITLVTTHHPEPSSILLLASGLLGMGIRARAKLKAKKRKVS